MIYKSITVYATKGQRSEEKVFDLQKEGAVKSSEGYAKRMRNKGYEVKIVLR